MNEIMTLDEVNRKYDSEWVLFGDPEQDEHHRLFVAVCSFIARIEMRCTGNWWNSGQGMPRRTLLGESLMRRPWCYDHAIRS